MGSKGKSISDVIDVSEDAQEYVNSIMSSQIITRVDNPTNTSRKRHHSEAGILSTSKKARNLTVDEVDQSDRISKRQLAKAKRNLYNKDTDTPVKPPSVVVTDADVHVSTDPTIQQLISKLSSDMHMYFNCLTERMDKLESGLEAKISNKVSQILDKRINNEVKKIHKEVDDFKCSLKEDIAEEFEEINARLDSLSNSDVGMSGENSIGLNVVIRDLPEHSSEDVKSKVDSLIKDGIKVNVTCENAERKESKIEGKPGVVIAKFKSYSDKMKVMSKKRDLVKNKKYENIYINHDQTKAERQMAQNFRTILGVMKNSGVKMIGSRVVRSSSDHDRSRYSSYDRSNSQEDAGNRGRDFYHRRNRDSDRGFSSGSRDNDFHSRGDQRNRTDSVNFSGSRGDQTNRTDSFNFSGRGSRHGNSQQNGSYRKRYEKQWNNSQRR
ncbi:uncharacterized protein LOC123532192 isoform X2 [Mercenaria mercenaria]|uniref:uncharacterized protein LOC123532192 isoform X2 n=1 Tax=Mercenaria mercenaria TaxID=6596 RepID=UPI00234E949D|nr:uncharacterized protein LOC123532192 isoform X2 [Mercenaria mercenaria]